MARKFGPFLIKLGNNLSLSKTIEIFAPEENCLPMTLHRTDKLDSKGPVGSSLLDRDIKALRTILMETQLNVLW